MRQASMQRHARTMAARNLLRTGPTRNLLRIAKSNPN
jgi:hypothetical protein